MSSMRTFSKDFYDFPTLALAVVGTPSSNPSRHQESLYTKEKVDLATVLEFICILARYRKQKIMIFLAISQMALVCSNVHKGKMIRCFIFQEPAPLRSALPHGRCPHRSHPAKVSTLKFSGTNFSDKGSPSQLV